MELQTTIDPNKKQKSTVISINLLIIDTYTLEFR